MTGEGKHKKSKEAPHNPRVLSMLDKYRQKAMRLSLLDLLETYKTSFGLHTTVIYDEILRRRRDGSLYKEHGTPRKEVQMHLPPAQLRAITMLVEFVESHNFIRADNASGGGIILRKITATVSLDAVLIRLKEDVTTLPADVVVYYRIECNDMSYGLVLHMDHDDYVVLFSA